MSNKNSIAKPNELCFQLLPVEWLTALAYLATKGAQKYAPRDWEENPGRYLDRVDSLHRHLNKWMTGETNDDGEGGTGVHNLAAVAYNALMVMVWEARGVGVDNRPKVSKAFLDNLASKLAGTSNKPSSKTMFHRGMIIKLSGIMEYRVCANQLAASGEEVASTTSTDFIYFDGLSKKWEGADKKDVLTLVDTVPPILFSEASRG